MSVAAQPAATSGYAARWEHHNDERRTQILRAAIELIEENPADIDISVMSIAKRAGLAKSVVYRQFSNKDELFRRVRSLVFEEFAIVLDAKLDVTSGSIREILTRTIGAVADWMLDHPRLNEFGRGGPTFDGDGSPDAVSEFVGRMAQRVDSIIAAIALTIQVDDSPFKTVPFALVTMVEATLFAWIRGAAPTRSREEMVSDLNDYVWYVLDGVAGSIGLEISPDEPLAVVIAGLMDR